MRGPSAKQQGFTPALCAFSTAGHEGEWCEVGTSFAELSPDPVFAIPARSCSQGHCHQCSVPTASQAWHSQLCWIARELALHPLAFTGLSLVFVRLCRGWIVGFPVCKAGSPSPANQNVIQDHVCEFFWRSQTLNYKSEREGKECSAMPS